MNFSDSEIIASIMGEHGFTSTNDELNADVIFLNTCAIRDNAEQRIRERLKHLRGNKKHNKELITVPFYTDYPYKWVFRLFDLIQFKSTMLGTPFAVGGFQLWNTNAYWRLGGYNEEELFAEDYSLSQKIKAKN